MRLVAYCKMFFCEILVGKLLINTGTNPAWSVCPVKGRGEPQRE